MAWWESVMKKHRMCPPNPPHTLRRGFSLSTSWDWSSLSLSTLQVNYTILFIYLFNFFCYLLQSFPPEIINFSNFLFPPSPELTVANGFSCRGGATGKQKALPLPYFWGNIGGLSFLKRILKKTLIRTSFSIAKTRTAKFLNETLVHVSKSRPRSSPPW